jgi:hypothetical protein
MIDLQISLVLVRKLVVVFISLLSIKFIIQVQGLSKILLLCPISGCELINKTWDSFADVKISDRSLIWCEIITCFFAVRSDQYHYFYCPYYFHFLVICVGILI